ncbi:MAG: hypothetical protein M3Y08_13110, partial [Fibrobacterota bacterium]|nr:hypothetical protein [Fibrobacterota bacterium]
MGKETVVNRSPFSIGGSRELKSNGLNLMVSLSKVPDIVRVLVIMGLSLGRLGRVNLKTCSALSFRLSITLHQLNPILHFRLWVTGCAQPLVDPSESASLSEFSFAFTSPSPGAAAKGEERTKRSETTPGEQLHPRPCPTEGHRVFPD